MNNSNTGSESEAGILSTLKRNERSIRRWSSSFSNIAQVIALVLVGIWGVTKFVAMEAPGLERHLKTGIDIGWMKIPEVTDRCLAKLTLTLENTCKKTIDITKVDVDGWLSAVPGKEHPSFVPEDELQQGDHFFQGSMPASNYLMGPLAPGAKAETSLLFTLKNDSTKRVFWKATFTTKQKMNYVAWAADWDFDCNYNH
jgi:hypothetical protein